MAILYLAANSLASGFLLGGVLALIALGLSIQLGTMRLVNLAHGEFLVVGAYVALIVEQHLSIGPLACLAIAAGTLALVALPVHRLLVAPLAGTGAEPPMMTMFGLSIVLQNGLLLAFSADTRTIANDYASFPLQVGPVTVPEIYVLGFSVSALLVYLVHLLVRRTSFGRDLRASTADPVAAAAVGIDVRRIHALAFGLGAACAAAGGVLIGMTFSFSPTSGANYLLLSFAVVVLGGVGNILGTLVAGIAMGVLQSLGAIALGDGYRDFTGLALLLLVLALRPGGIGPPGQSR
jgi:branched-chain amino acid transport system permease protein